MCVTAVVLAGASLAASAAGTIATIDNNNYQAGMLQLQMDEQRNQLREQQKFEQLKAQEAELARLEDYRGLREANLLAVAGSGVGQNLSFLSGVSASDEKALKMDLGNIRLGMLGEQNRIANQIRVNDIDVRMAKSNAKSANVAAGIGFLKDATKIASTYGKTK
ncbi:hypothetical protein UFOVP616_22 [uncultured Caudovirales phage]|uniref:Uncharacterized protein n=1 Tax=uncultured Caudovirales phage TaxID=2100421 RepID=A0A6J5N5U4_9CAUD|nr:hypothetical protein UFOVP616_22 [uncultured Caudovirales phage]